MNFQQQNQIKNQLAQLRNQILKKHFWVSIPLTILLVIGFTVVNFTMHQQYSATSPEFFLPEMMEMRYKYALQYFDFYHQMALRVLSANASRSSYSTLEETVENYIIPKTGMACLIGTQIDCNSKFIGLATLSWQYQKVASLNQIIQRIFVCSITDNLTCAGTALQNNILAASQRSFIIQITKNAFNSSKSMSVFNGELNRGFLIAIQPGQMVTIIKLCDFKPTITKLFNQLDKDLILSYKIQLIYPISTTILEDKADNINHEDHIQVKKTINLNSDSSGEANDAKIIQFNVQYKRINQSRYFLTKLSSLVPLILIAYLLNSQRKNITLWVQRNFARKKLINQLYKYTIRDIFTGAKLNPSNVLQRGPSSQLFKQLSGVVDRSITSIVLDPEPLPHKQAFKFNIKINEIIQKYKQLIRPLMHAKNRYIIANRFNIQSYINDLSQAENKLMKEYYVKAHQLEIDRSFFRFAYVAILKSPEKFISFIQEDSTPLPEDLVNYFMKANQHIHQVDLIRQRIEDLTQNRSSLNGSSQDKANEEDIYLQENKQQIQIRIRVQIIPKYLAMLKDLDIANQHAIGLKLQRQLWSLAEIIENTRYLLTKHNKSIGLFNK